MAERQTLKRRGLIAGAAAMIAGIAAKQAAQPVRAVHQPEDLGLGIDNLTSNLTSLVYTGGVISGGHAAFKVGDSSSNPVSDLTAALGGFAISTTPGSGGAVNTGVYGVSADNGGYGVYGEGLPGGIGVYGKSGSNYGVRATSSSGIGVYSTSNGDHAIEGNLLAPNTSAKAGVFGFGNGGNTFGVLGDGFTSGIGVQGQNGTIGVSGSSPSGYGVYGSSTSGIGTRGDTNASGSFGVLGVTFAPNSIALGGIANADGSSCFSGGTSNPNAFAAFFQGHVQVTQGAFDVIPLGNKHGLAPHPDGSHRTFYSVESPECWVEDFGEGTLTAGKASIALDADFATLVHTDHYHVFITEHDQHNALHVTNRTASGFTVAADAASVKAKGANIAQVSGTFSWRVVAKPKTTANVDRLAKATVGHFPLPDVSKLPKPPPPSPATKKP